MLEVDNNPYKTGRYFDICEIKSNMEYCIDLRRKFAETYNLLMDRGHLHRCNHLYALTLKDYRSANERLSLSDYISEYREPVREIVSYCVNDVEILTEACLKFRNMMLTECNVEPFLECV